MNDSQIIQLFNPLYADVLERPNWPKEKPLLAHYTSISNLEAIMRGNEIWLSNPLFMNDMDEVRFGFNAGADFFRSSSAIESAAGSKARFEKLKSAFDSYHDKFANVHVLDTYIFCLSEHEKDDDDGLLSMWRGYGGSGNGAAIVFESGKVNAKENSPLVIAKVEYGSKNERLDWLKELVEKFAHILSKADIVDEKLYLCSYVFIERLKFFSIFTKDRGFREENEWRLAYMRGQDINNLLDRMFGYWIGPRGVEPKLKFKIEPILDFTDADFSFSKIIDRIILGPSLSSPLAKATICKMLDTLGRSDLKERIKSSTIPFRA